MRHIKWRAAAVLVVLTAGLFSWFDESPLANAFAAPTDGALTAQTSREGGVTVEVTPRNLVPGASNWDFEVVLSTHTQPLDQDLVAVARLIDPQGKSHSPVGWEGDPPGGHHRRGLLRFKPMAGNPASVELRLQGVGGDGTRVFRWQLK